LKLPRCVRYKRAIGRLSGIGTGKTKVPIMLGDMMLIVTLPYAVLMR